MRGNDSDDFGISETGELSFSSNPNHEQPVDSNSDNVYEITVVASDGQNEGTLEVTVTVTEVNEGPEISGRGTLTVSENYKAVLAAYSATDPEDTSAEITRWSVTGRDGGDFAINEDGELTFRSPPDYERPADSDRDNEYEVTVRASDGQVYGTYDVTVTVEAVDEVTGVPEWTAVTHFPSGRTALLILYTYRATDPEGADVSWSVTAARTAETLPSQLTAAVGVVLSFEEPPDYDDPADDDDDNEYEVTVVATDQTGHAASLAVTVTVTDVNEGPVQSLAPLSTPCGRITKRRTRAHIPHGTRRTRALEITTLERYIGNVTAETLHNQRRRRAVFPQHRRTTSGPPTGNRDNVYEVHRAGASDGQLLWQLRGDRNRGGRKRTAGHHGGRLP